MKELIRSALVSVAVVAAGLFVYHRYFAPEVAVMDVAGYMQYRKARFMDEWKDRQASEDQLRKAAEEYTDESKRRIDAAAGSVRGNRVILFKDVVVNNKKMPYVVLEEEADKMMEKLRDGR